MIKTAQDIRTYKKQLKEGLCDQFLRTALDNFNTAYRGNRPAVYEGIDFEGIKKEIAAAKDAALPRLIELFEAFKIHAKAAGVNVHAVQDAKQANEIIAAIAKENNVKKIIKAKSMTAEETFLKVLPRNAAGQAITSYVTWIKGAVECGSAPANRKIMHVVFLDNGRLTLAKDPVFSEALRCIRCGACANVCPVYSKVGGHKYGHVYIGAIGLILLPRQGK